LENHPVYVYNIILLSSCAR